MDIHLLFIRNFGGRKMLLEMKNITKSYGPVLANDNISLNLNKGEILAVVGENGAGKSTIMKILYGLEMPSSGEIYIRGQVQNFRNPQDAIGKGIGMVQQHFMLFNPFTVAENIVYGHEPRNQGLFFDRKKACKLVEELSDKYGLAVDPKKKVGDCPVGIQQRVEILKILYQNADILIFDEPTAVLTPQEIEELLNTLKNLSKIGKSIILITHKLQEVMDVADRILVMRNGKYIKEMDKKDTNIEEISQLMVGRQLMETKIFDQKTGEDVLLIEDLVLKGSDNKNIIDELSIHVGSGEIVGLAGVSGNGQSELIKLITGLQKADGGKISLSGKDILNTSVENIRKAGCACIPEDRYLWGCAKEASLIETGIMGHHKKSEFSKHGLLKNDSIRNYTKNIIKRHDVRCNSIMQKAGELSGGNIQKLIVAREIEQKTKFLLAAEPTRGVDIGAMEFIHKELLEKRQKGDAILLISSELSEIMSLSDRIYVIFDGKINGEFTRENASLEQIGLLMMGGKSSGQDWKQDN